MTKQDACNGIQNVFEQIKNGKRKAGGAKRSATLSRRRRSGRLQGAFPYNRSSEGAQRKSMAARQPPKGRQGPEKRRGGKKHKSERPSCSTSAAEPFPRQERSRWCTPANRAFLQHKRAILRILIIPPAFARIVDKRARREEENGMRAKGRRHHGQHTRGRSRTTQLRRVHPGGNAFADRVFTQPPPLSRATPIDTVTVAPSLRPFFFIATSFRMFPRLVPCKTKVNGE